MKTKYWLATGVAAISCNSFAVLNGVETTYPAVVRLTRTTFPGECSGSIVGLNPVTIVTALHCIENLETGGVRVSFEDGSAVAEGLNEVPDEAYVSTRATISQPIREHPLYSDYQKVVDEEKEAVIVPMVIVQLSRSSPPKPVPLFTLKKTKLLNQILGRSLETDALDHPSLRVPQERIGSADVAILEFAQLRVARNESAREWLVSQGQLFAVEDRSLNFAQTPGRVYGFGVDKLDTSKMSPGKRPLRNARTSVRKSRQTGMIFSYGYPFENYPNQVAGEKSHHYNYGSILPGDSGGPLVLEENRKLIGVNSATRSTTINSAPGADWPTDDNFDEATYPVRVNAFVDLTSRASQAALREAYDAGGDIEGIGARAYE